MSRFRPYIPLMSFVLPTVVVGYGVVIPRSCIAGVNELTIGFGTTILGAVLTYFAGQRAVLPAKRGGSPPLRVRIERAINRQAASPRGWFGRLLGFVWGREHAFLNDVVVARLGVNAEQHVLEVGCGPGHALARIAKLAPGGKVRAVDISPLMVELAKKRNRAAVARGEVEVCVGDVMNLEVETSSLDRIVAVHSIYFWRDVDAVLDKLAKALKPGGKLVLAFRPEGTDIPPRFRDPTYRFPRAEDVVRSLSRAGLRVESTACAGLPGLLLVEGDRPA